MMRHYEKHERYQYQPWYVKLWRNRWEIAAPFYAIKCWIKYRLSRRYKTEAYPLTFSNIMDMEWGLADCKKGHLLDWDEIPSRLEYIDKD